MLVEGATVNVKKYTGQAKTGQDSCLAVCHNISISYIQSNSALFRRVISYCGAFGNTRTEVSASILKKQKHNIFFHFNTKLACCYLLDCLDWWCLTITGIRPFFRSSSIAVWRVLPRRPKFSSVGRNLTFTREISPAFSTDEWAFKVINQCFISLTVSVHVSDVTVMLYSGFCVALLTWSDA